MARERTGVPPKLKQQLLDEAGGKCANPGCSSLRTHIHHIREWAIYETHDSKHMVAICPTCHDAVHHGPLTIHDETIRHWKRIKRSTVPGDHVYVEPGESSKLLLGTITATGPEGLIVFDLAASNRLSFRLVERDIMLLNLAMSSTSGKELLRIVENHVRLKAEDPVTYERVPGRVRVTSPASDAYLPDWAFGQLRQEEPDFARDGRLPLLDIEVVEPGVVRVQGLWHDAEHAVAITLERLTFLDRTRPKAFSIVGQGGGFYYTGPITTALFELGGKAGPRAVRRTPSTKTAPHVGRNDPCWCGSGHKFKRCHGA